MSTHVRFVGGPWDGAESDLPQAPDAIYFTDLHTEARPTEQPLVTELVLNKRDHQYILHDCQAKVWIYRYAPGERLWWEE